MMSDWVEVDEPKVWVSRFLRYIDNIGVNWVSDVNRIEFTNAFKYSWRLVEPEVAPKFLYFDRSKKIQNKNRDAFVIVGGVLVISKELRDVLVQFDLGNTQLFEVPIYADESVTPSGLPNHYVLNVNAPKDALIPELSENIKKPVLPGQKEPRPNAKWSTVRNLEVLAVNAATACVGADLWHDPEMNDTFFMSDRLKKAIDAAGLKTSALSLKPARMFERN